MSEHFTIYYTSDIHGYFSPVDYGTGKPAATGLCNCMTNYRHDGNSLVIDGGDNLQGSPFAYFMGSHRKAAECVHDKIMNIAGYDFVTLGNHEFNYGKEYTQKYINGLNATCLCANVSGLENIKKTAVVTLENGLRLGLTGIVTDFINLWEQPENIAGIEITEAFPAVKAAYEELKAQNVDVTVCIYHGGFECDLDTGERVSKTEENQAYRICRELGFDILLTAHQHRRIENRNLFGTHVCQNPDKAATYIKLDADVDEDGKVTVTSKLCPAGAVSNAEAVDFLRPYDEATDEFLDNPVGHFDTELLPEAPLEMAMNGTLIANFFNQVQLDATGADVSCTSLGNSVKGFEKTVTIRDIVSTYIYPNTLKVLEVDRSILKSALERCAQYFKPTENGVEIGDTFLKPGVQHYNYDYFSGIRVTYDISRREGDRVVSIVFDGEELSPDKKLSLCMNNYRATGTGGYECYTQCRELRDTQTEVCEMIIDYVLEHRDVVVDKTKWFEVIR